MIFSIVWFKSPKWYLAFDLEKYNHVDIEIFDNLGRRVWNKNNARGYAHIKNLPAGSYTVKLSNNNIPIITDRIVVIK